MAGRMKHHGFNFQAVLIAFQLCCVCVFVVNILPPSLHVKPLNPSTVLSFSELNYENRRLIQNDSFLIFIKSACCFYPPGSGSERGKTGNFFPSTPTVEAEKFCRVWQNMKICLLLQHKQHFSLDKLNFHYFLVLNCVIMNWSQIWIMKNVGRSGWNVSFLKKLKVTQLEASAFFMSLTFLTNKLFFFRWNEFSRFKKSWRFIKCSSL